MNPVESTLPLIVNDGLCLDCAEKSEDKPHLDHSQDVGYDDDDDQLIDLPIPNDESVLDDTVTETFPDVLYKSVKTLLSKDEHEQARILCEENISKLIKPSGTKLDNLILSNAFDSLALVYSATNEFDNAIEMLSKVLDIRKKELGDDHLSVATTLNNMAVYHQKLDNYLDAQTSCRRSLQIKIRHLGKRHLQIGKSYYNLAIFYHKEGQCDIAEEFYKQALQIYNQRLDHDDPAVTKANFNLTSCHSSRGEDEEASTM